MTSQMFLENFSEEGSLQKGDVLCKIGVPRSIDFTFLLVSGVLYVGIADSESDVVCELDGDDGVVLQFYE